MHHVYSTHVYTTCTQRLGPKAEKGAVYEEEDDLSKVQCDAVIDVDLHVQFNQYQKEFFKPNGEKVFNPDCQLRRIPNTLPYGPTYYGWGVSEANNGVAQALSVHIIDYVLKGKMLKAEENKMRVGECKETLKNEVTASNYIQLTQLSGILSLFMFVFGFFLEYSG